MDKISNISHIYFTGGGLKGLCYIGIIRYLYIEGIVDKIKNVIGTSIGAYFGTILALKMPLEYIETECGEIVSNIKDYLTISKSNLTNLFNKKGVFNLDFMIKPIVKWVQMKYDVDDISFLDFVKRTGINLYINSLNIHNGQYVTFSAEATPNVSVIQALRASMSIPLMFEPVLIDGEYYSDCVISRFDILNNVDKKNKLILKLPLDKCVSCPKNKHFDFLEYFFRVNEVMIGVVDAYLPESEEICDIKDLPYNSCMKFDCNDKDIYVQITLEDMDNLIVQGFVDIALYMKKRFVIQK